MQYFFNYPIVLRQFDQLWNGLLLAIGFAFVSLLIGAALGIVAAFARVYGGPALRGVVATYVEVVRNIPFLLLIFIMYFGIPSLKLGLGTFRLRLDENGATIAALAIYAGAYLTEIFRAGILAVPRQQIEAGRALGLTGLQVAWLITLPITFRVVLPSLGSTLISLFKDTSIASAISVRELTYAGIQINLQTWRVIEVWSLVAALYLATTAALAAGLRFLERRFAIPGWGQ